MTAPTHIVFAALSIQGYCLLFGEPLHPALFVSSMLASIVPDIDLPSSAMGRIFRPFSVYLFNRFGHRTITHSAISVIVAAIVFYPLRMIEISAPIYTAAILGYLSHLIIDMNNTDGIALTYPLPHRWIFPANIDYRFRVGSKGENILRGVLIFLAIGVTFLHFASPRTILHKIMGTPSAASTEYYQQLLLKNKVEVEISGIWTHKQTPLQKELFEVVAADDFSVYVRHYDEPYKIYAVGTGPYTSISHAKITPKMSIIAEQRVVSVTFEDEKWRPELVFEYPNAIVSGQITATSSYYPTFDIDEFQTIRRFSDRWTITHCPIERLSEVLDDTSLLGTLYIRYWRSAGG
jgi:inner membrane protein